MHIARSFHLNKSTTKLENPFGNDIVIFCTTVLCDVITHYDVTFELAEVTYSNQLEILYKTSTKNRILIGKIIQNLSILTRYA